MKVKIGDTTYDAEQVPIKIMLSQSDKDNIKNMQIDSFTYVCFPDTIDWEEIKGWANE